MTIHTFEVTCTVPGDEYYLIQEKLKSPTHPNGQRKQPECVTGDFPSKES